MVDPNKNTVVFIGNFKLPDSNAAAQRVISNAKLFQAIGFRPIIYGYYFNDGVSLKKSSFFEKIECKSLKYPSNIYEWISYYVTNKDIKSISYACKHEDIYAVVLYNYPAIPIVIGKHFLNKKNILCISDSTEWYGEQSGRLLQRFVKFLDTFLRMKISNKYVNGLMTTSNFLTNHYRNIQKPILELPTLYDKSNYKYFCESKKNKVRSVSYAGIPFDLNSTHKNKFNVKERLDLVIMLFYTLYKKNIGFTFNIYGVGLKEYLLVYPDHEIVLEKMKGVVKFFGKVAHQEVMTKVCQSDFTIFSRDVNRVTLSGFPTKLAESIICGVPVITNKTPNLLPYKELNNYCFFLDFSDMENCSSRLIEVLTMSEVELKQIKTKCRNSDLFNYLSYKEQALSFFKEIKF